MRTGVSYMGHHNPRHLKTDMADLKSLACDDVLLAAQENDFVHMTGKLTFLPGIARDVGIRPVAIFWGALNLFGGGRSSQFLLENPSGHQVRRDGSHHPAGCYVNPLCAERIRQMVDRIAELGFEGYFIDEPRPIDCYCASCREMYETWYGGDLPEADAPRLAEFRGRCVMHYVGELARYIKTNHAGLETMCCLMPADRQLWAAAAEVAELDNLGTDIYWVNNDRPVREAEPMVRDLAGLCARHGKTHHEWLQCWHVRAGREDRVRLQGDVLIRQRPDALYVWAYEGQIGTVEACDDPQLAWSKAREILLQAKEQS